MLPTVTSVLPDQNHHVDVPKASTEIQMSGGANNAHSDGDKTTLLSNVLKHQHAKVPVSSEEMPPNAMNANKESDQPVDVPKDLMNSHGLASHAQIDMSHLTIDFNASHKPVVVETKSLDQPDHAINARTAHSVLSQMPSKESASKNVHAHREQAHLTHTDVKTAHTGKSQAQTRLNALTELAQVKTRLLAKIRVLATSALPAQKD
jgi:hypothetical protein